MGILDRRRRQGAGRRREGDAVFVTVTSAAANFSMQFAGCSAQGRACRAVLLDAPWRAARHRGPGQRFNQTSVMCRVYQDKAGSRTWSIRDPVPQHDARRRDTHLQAWQGCRPRPGFPEDPVGYLANAA